MKANTGMIYPVAAPISAYVPHTSITYGAGFVVAEAREANVTWETENGEFYGDNILLDSFDDIVGYSIEFEPSGLSDTVRNKLLGETKETSANIYHVTGAKKPDLGFGYIKNMADDSSGTVVESYEAWWFNKVRFSQPNERAATKERSKTWTAPTISGRGSGVFLDSSDTPDFAKHEDFTTLAAAKSWLNGLAGISAGSGT